MKTRSYKIRGVAPLVMHNARLSDPLDKWTKLVAEISKKRKKTDADYLELSRREWFGGLYLDDDDKPRLLGKHLERMLRDAATKSKLGKAVQAGLMVFDEDVTALEFPGSKLSPDKLWDDGGYLLRASCKVGQARVLRTRPCFPKWAFAFTVNYDEDLLNGSQIDEFVDLAGRIVGLLDWRPKHGRFALESKS